MYLFFCAGLLISAVVCGLGFLALMLSIAFDEHLNWNRWFTVKPCMLGLVGVILFGIGAVITVPSTPMTRAIVGNKQEREYTMMVMVGKVMIPQYHHDYYLISNEGAKCSVNADSYAQYRVGDAVVCGWR